MLSRQALSPLVEHSAELVAIRRRLAVVAARFSIEPTKPLFLNHDILLFLNNKIILGSMNI